jgi:nucleotide-binding universal stress UspA family protein
MTFGRVLIALDESALAAHAVAAGCDLARALKADIALVYVVDPTLAFLPESGIPAADLMAELKREGERLLSAAAKRIGDSPTWQFVRMGKPADEVLAAAREWNADLIVIGTHGRSGMSRLVMGSTAESVLRRAACPVLVVRANE